MGSNPKPPPPDAHHPQLLTIALIDFRPTNPNRPPNWRWEYANYLTQGGLRMARYSDRFVGLAKNFALRLRDCSSEGQLLRLTQDFPDVFEAHAIYTDVNARSCRSIIEARLLAGQTDEEIARVASKRMTTQTIAVFEKLFFSVREELDRADYILTNVFPADVHRGFDARDYDLVWKLFAYYGGPAVLDVVVHSFANLQRSDGTLSSIMASLKYGMRSQLLLKAAIAVRAMSINGKTQGEIMNSFLRMLNVERDEDGGNAIGEARFEAGMKAFLDSIPWSSGMTSQSKNAFVARVDASAQSLRVPELLAVADGTVPPGLETLLASARFPEDETPRAEAGQ